MYFLLNILLQTGEVDKKKLVVVSISPQSRASLATKYQLSPQEAHHKLTGFFKKLGLQLISLFSNKEYL